MFSLKRIWLLLMLRTYCRFWVAVEHTIGEYAACLRHEVWHMKYLDLWQPFKSNLDTICYYSNDNRWKWEITYSTDNENNLLTNLIPSILWIQHFFSVETEFENKIKWEIHNKVKKIYCILQNIVYFFYIIIGFFL